MVLKFGDVLEEVKGYLKTPPRVCSITPSRRKAIPKIAYFEAYSCICRDEMMMQGPKERGNIAEGCVHGLYVF